MLKFRFLAAALLCGAAQAAPSANWDQPMATLLRVDWNDPINPGLVPLGKDRFLFDTREGLRLFDANTAQFLPLKADPAAAAGSPERLLFGDSGSAALGAGTLMFGLSRDRRLATLWGWNAATQSLAVSLALPRGQDEFANWRFRLLGLDARHALVCHPEKGARVVRWDPQAPAPLWAAYGDAAASIALQGRSVVGPVQGFGTYSLPAAGSARPPVYYDTQRCGWELTQPPAELAPHLDRQRRGDHNPRIKPYFLDDGRVLVPELEYFDTVKPGNRWIANPLLWDANANAWRPLAAFRSERPYWHRSGQQPPVLASGRGSALVEALHLPTLTWRRFNEHLPYTAFDCLLEPLQSGQLLVVARGTDARFQGVVGRVTPSDGTVPPGRLHHDRETRYGEVIVLGRGTMLIGARERSQSDVAEWVDAATAQSTEMPRLPAGQHWPAFTTGVALPDGGVLVLGGMHLDCVPESLYTAKGVCADRVGRPTWRYSSAAQRWQAVPTLRIPFSRGPYWQSGNPALWPRADLNLRANGDLVWLQGGEFPESTEPRERELWPRSTALMAWSPAEPDRPPRRIAALRKGRTSGSVVTLTDGRLVVVGGDAQLERVALQKSCTDCPDEFVSIGPMRAARSTEVLDESNPHSPHWLVGPQANFPGGQGFRLDNGRVVKVSLREPVGEKGVQAEVADAAFTQWTRLPLPPAVPPDKDGRHNDIAFVTAIGNRVVVVVDANATLVWDDDAGSWRLHVGWPGLHEGTRALSVTAGAKAGEVLVRYPRTVRLLTLPKH